MGKKDFFGSKYLSPGERKKASRRWSAPTTHTRKKRKLASRMPQTIIVRRMSFILKEEEEEEEERARKLIIFIFSSLLFEGRGGRASRVWKAMARKAEIPTKSVILWVSKKAVSRKPIPLIVREVVMNIFILINLLL